MEARSFPVYLSEETGGVGGKRREEGEMRSEGRKKKEMGTEEGERDQ